MNLLRLKLGLSVGGGGALGETLISHSTSILCESCTLNSGRHCSKVITQVPLLTDDDSSDGPCEKDVGSNSVKSLKFDDCNLNIASTHTVFELSLLRSL